MLNKPVTIFVGTPTLKVGQTASYIPNSKCELAEVVDPDEGSVDEG
jgi:hypothetical protein